MGTILILGATSGIARATAAEFARQGRDLVLLARNPEELAAIAADLRLRHGVAVRTHRFDALDCDAHEAVLGPILAEEGEALEGALLCYGYMAEQATAQQDWQEARRILDTNFTGAVSALNVLANHFEAQGRGVIAAIGSVAGDRGRQSNYLYGAAKAGLATYLQGLRNRLAPKGVAVVTIKPGFVDTPMTHGKPGLFLVASPETAARGIYAAMTRGRDVAYVPWFWMGIMGLIRAIPEPVFKRMKL